MSASRVAAGAAAGAAGAWGLKGAAIAVAGGLGESPLETPLFLLGLLAILVALVALGLAAVPGRWTGGPKLAAVAGVVLGGIAASLLLQALLGALLPDGWAQGEAGLWVSAAVVTAIAIARLRREGALAD